MNLSILTAFDVGGDLPQRRVHQKVNWLREIGSPLNVVIAEEANDAALRKHRGLIIDEPSANRRIRREVTRSFRTVCVMSPTVTRFPSRVFATTKPWADP
jgi:hypothetical protein